MNRTLTHTLSTLIAIAAIAPAAIAGEVAIKSSTLLSGTAYTPVDLVKAAYNGQLEGIPSFGDLKSATAFGSIEAEDLVEAGIAKGRLTEEALTDRGFLTAVDNAIDTLSGN